MGSAWVDRFGALGRARLRGLARAPAVLLLAAGGALLLLGRPLVAVATLGLGGTLLATLLQRLAPLATPAEVAAALDRAHPELEDSTALLLTAGATGAPSLAARQRRLVARRMERLCSTHALPALLPLPLPRPLTPVLWAVSLACVVAVAGLRPGAAGTVPPETPDLRIDVTPPPYTAVDPWSTTAPAVTVPAGSRVTWTLTGGQFPHWEAEGHTEAMTGAPPAVHRTVHADLVYRLSWGPPEQRALRPGTVTVTHDAPPEVRIETPMTSPFAFDVPPPGGLALAAELRDDYGLASAALLLTVASGEGEGVKFREQRVAVTPALEADARGGTLRAALDPGVLGMAPGDELYVRVEARDARSPSPNRALSRTVVFRWAGDEARSAALAGLPVDRMPEYFRSQRQIIIDTERLLGDAAAIGRPAFEERSAALAADQRTLRLRYGRFLGEEAEEGGSPLPGTARAAAAEAGDDHTHHEHDAGGGDPADAAHDHADPRESVSGATGEASAADLIAAFGHSHDYAEQATLFDPGTRATLKGALDAMWRSEGELGVYAPAAALPAQYEALRQLKAVQQAARIYVARVGFEPPPLTEERRGTGELTDAAGSRVSRSSAGAPAGVGARLMALLADDARPAPSLLRAIVDDPAAPVDERGAASRWLANAACGDCRRALLESLAARRPDPVPAATRRPFTGSAAAAEAYLRALATPSR